MFPISCIVPFYFGMLAHAATVTYNFNVTWVTANPDGVFSRPVMGINGQWPIPYISATVGDRVVVNVLNQLGNASTSLHFHGLYMNGTSHMDGPVGVTQCSIAPETKFTYNFTVNQPGTYWYHSHEPGQYPDGLRGPMIITDPDSPYRGKYDEERVLTMSDWYHQQFPALVKKFISVSNPTGAEPIPKAALLNDTQNLTTLVEPGKTYMFRIINMGAFAGQYFWIEGHTMQIVEVDGIYTKEAAADMIYLTAGQRYSVLVTTRDNTSANFAYVASMDQDLFDKPPKSLNPNVTGWLVYKSNANLPEPAFLESFEPFDDFTLAPIDGEPLLPDPDFSVPLTVLMINLGDGANYASFNSVPYTIPKVPTLYSALTTGDEANNPAIYGINSNAFVLQKYQTVDIIVNNHDPGKHPFHLHGHNFQAIVRSDDDAGSYVGNETFPSVPMRRDTFMVRPNGNMVLRFRADNPDKSLPPHHPPTSSLPPTNMPSPPPRIWLFHCHIEWHVASGLVATLIESPTSLQHSLGPLIPQNHYDACTAQNVPIAGNAAGNTKDLLDLDGANKPPPPLPEGFTPKGIVALVFSILTAFLGMAVIAWYGVGEIGSTTSSSKPEAAVATESQQVDHIDI